MLLHIIPGKLHRVQFLLSHADVISVIKEEFYSEIMKAKFSTLKKLYAKLLKVVTYAHQRPIIINNGKHKRSDGWSRTCSVWCS
jgi:hypothetical protein